MVNLNEVLALRGASTGLLLSFERTSFRCEAPEIRGFFIARQLTPSPIDPF